jgi:2-methylisocitrate lyase-like PEP mutase family enzyme
MTQAERAHVFAKLHVKGHPLVLYNIWDAGTARAAVAAGAGAVATGSWSVAAAHGYPDGEAIPLAFLAEICRRIAQSVAVPFSVDFEGGYGVAPADVAASVATVLATGAIGINFEDQIVGGDGLYPVAAQVERLQAVRQMADRAGIALFINARTDLFLKESDRSRHAGLIDQAVERAAAYAGAGASGFFAPGLGEVSLIEQLASRVSLPLNIMMRSGVPDLARLSRCGVARVSHGPAPYRTAMAAFETAAKAALQG